MHIKGLAECLVHRSDLKSISCYYYHSVAVWLFLKGKKTASDGSKVLHLALATRERLTEFSLIPSPNIEGERFTSQLDYDFTPEPINLVQ